MLITNINPETSLWTRLDHLIAESDEMRVLVGFFYFWSIQALHDGLRKNPDARIKILVGLQAGERAGAIVEYADQLDEKSSDDEHRKAFLRALANVMRGRQIDTESYYRRASLFIDLLASGRIEIRKTCHPNHAKLYHFTLKQSLAAVLDRPWCWITGSSNLTRPGLAEQHELNVQVLDFGGQETRDFFDALWHTAIPLTDDPETRTRILELVAGDESLLAEITPFEAYALVLKHYLEHRALVDRSPTIQRVFEEPAGENGAPKFKPFRFQIDAVNQALAILQAYNGVIIADVVGLGKSVVASVLGRVNARRGIVIAPPGLVGDPIEGTGWWGYLQDFRLHDWRVVSRGKMEDILELVNRQQDFELVVVDEAHSFRNQDSEDYHYLSQICRGKQVMLLTATPYSNRPGDMFSLLKLFTPARHSLLVPDGNLEACFRHYQAEYRLLDYALKHLDNPDRAPQVESRLLKLGIHDDLTPANLPRIRQALKDRCRRLAAEIRQVIEPVMIRRNRLDLRGDPDYAAEVGRNLPTLHDPVEQYYELSPVQSAFYDRVIKQYFGQDSEFTGAIYQPGAYVPGALDPETDPDAADDPAALFTNQQRNMYKFIRRLLVRRFESSFGAFARTLDNLIRAHENVHRLATPDPLGRGIVVLDRALMDKLLNLEDAPDDEINALLERYETPPPADADAPARRKNIQIFRVSEDFDDAGRERFFRDLRADFNLLKRVRAEVKTLDLVANDPKANTLIREIQSVLDGAHPAIRVDPGEPRRKVLVFTEFGDTVNHLQAYLDHAFPGRVLTIHNLNKTTAATVLHNFDGQIPADHRQDEYHVLLATEKMSEGFNLNRAGLVINYDIPWNPTRVIQRVGRINRIGAKIFQDLYLFNFFPTEQGAGEHNVRQIATNKMFMIHTAIGEDARIFHPDEEPTPAAMYQRLTVNPDQLETEGFLTQARREWAEIRKQHPEIVRKLENLPGRVKSNRIGTPAGTYLFTRKGMTLFALRRDPEDIDGDLDDGIRHLAIHDAIAEIKCAFDTPRGPEFSETFWPDYQALQESLDARRHGAQPGAASLITKARNVLLHAISNGIRVDFAKTLLDDIQNHGTLAERTLRRIVETDAQPAPLNEVLDRLRHEMGADYLQTLKSQLPPNEIIVAIEHQPDGVG